MSAWLGSSQVFAVVSNDEANDPRGEAEPRGHGLNVRKCHRFSVVKAARLVAEDALTDELLLGDRSTLVGVMLLGGGLVVDQSW
jgi:hypothetical protein